MSLTVKAQLPANAHLDVPEDTPIIVISRHRDTPRGRRNALRSRRRIFSEYRHSHGNAAASRCWIEREGEMLDVGELEIQSAIE